MSMQQARLPQLEGGWFVTDGGIETVLIYNEGIPLPEFAAFVLLDKPDGRDTLRRYYRRYLDIAAGALGAGYILEVRLGAPATTGAPNSVSIPKRCGALTPTPHG